MTRKITFILILILLVASCIFIIFGTQEFIVEKFETVDELKQKKSELDKNYFSIDKAISTDMPNKKRILETTIEQYQNTKNEYESVLAQYSARNASQVVDEDIGKNMYDVEFLWTIIGNYATEEGINLKFDIVPNTTSPQAYANSSSDYVICDLKFSVKGPYINLTDFIYDIEDDDRLNFEINDFSFKRNDEQNDSSNSNNNNNNSKNNSNNNSEPLKALFNVYAVKINKLNFIENYSVVSDNYTNNSDNGNNTGNGDSTANGNTVGNGNTTSNGNTTGNGNTTVNGNTTSNGNTTVNGNTAGNSSKTSLN